MSPLEKPIDSIRRSLVTGVTGPFGHAEYPLASTLNYRGDEGLFGPDSMTWRIVGDVAAFVGGIRALLIQAAHPEVAAGVGDHSTYREDPLGRLSRTSAYVTATSFGALPEVDDAIDIVRRAHRPVAGTSSRGRRYSAATPAFGAWVHNALTDSFLAAYRFFGPSRLSEREADQYVSEQTTLGARLRVDPLIETADGLSRWLTDHPDAGPSPAMHDAIRFLRKPPLSAGQQVGYRILFNAAAATLPRRLRRILGVRRAPGAIWLGRLAVRTLRWALGSSPTWNLALIRVGAPIPPGMFHQPLPVPVENASRT